MSGSSFYNAPEVVKKTRKPHVCAYCGKTIPKGTARIIKESGFWMGEFLEALFMPRLPAVHKRVLGMARLRKREP